MYTLKKLGLAAIFCAKALKIGWKVDINRENDAIFGCVVA